jgi:hypothetical protein
MPAARREFDKSVLENPKMIDGWFRFACPFWVRRLERWGEEDMRMERWEDGRRT